MFGLFFRLKYESESRLAGTVSDSTSVFPFLELNISAVTPRLSPWISDDPLILGLSDQDNPMIQISIRTILVLNHSAELELPCVVSCNPDSHRVHSNCFHECLVGRLNVSLSLVEHHRFLSVVLARTVLGGIRDLFLGGHSVVLDPSESMVHQAPAAPLVFRLAVD